MGVHAIQTSNASNKKTILYIQFPSYITYTHTRTHIPVLYHPDKLLLHQKENRETKILLQKTGLKETDIKFA